MTHKEELRFWNEMKSTYMDRITSNVTDNENRRKAIEAAEIRLKGYRNLLKYANLVIEELQVKDNDSDEQRSD